MATQQHNGNAARAYDVDAVRRRMSALRGLLGLEPSPRRYWRGAPPGTMADGAPSAAAPPPRQVDAPPAPAPAPDRHEPTARWPEAHPSASEHDRVGTPSQRLGTPHSTPGSAAHLSPQIQRQPSASAGPFAAIRAVAPHDPPRTPQRNPAWDGVDYVRPPSAHSNRYDLSPEHERSGRERDLSEQNEHLRALLAAERRETALLRGEAPDAGVVPATRHARGQSRDGWFIPMWFTVDLGEGAKAGYILRDVAVARDHADARAAAREFGRTLAKEVAAGLHWEVGLAVRCVSLTPAGGEHVEAEVQFLFQDGNAADAFGEWVQNVVKKATRRFPDGWTLPKTSRCYMDVTRVDAYCQVDIPRTVVGEACPVSRENGAVQETMREGPRDVPEILARVDVDYVDFDPARFLAGLRQYLRQRTAEYIHVDEVPTFHTIDSYELNKARGLGMSFIHLSVGGTDANEEWAHLISELGEAGKLYRSLRVLSAEALVSKESHQLRRSSPSRRRRERSAGADRAVPARNRLADRVLSDRSPEDTSMRQPEPGTPLQVPEKQLTPLSQPLQPPPRETTPPQPVQFEKCSTAPDTAPPPLPATPTTKPEPVASPSPSPVQQQPAPAPQSPGLPPSVKSRAASPRATSPFPSMKSMARPGSQQLPAKGQPRPWSRVGRQEDPMRYGPIKSAPGPAATAGKSPPSMLTRSKGPPRVASPGGSSRARPSVQFAGSSVKAMSPRGDTPVAHKLPPTQGRY